MTFCKHVPTPKICDNLLSWKTCVKIVFVQHCDIYLTFMWPNKCMREHLMPWNEVAACGISDTQGNNENVNINKVNAIRGYKSSLSTVHAFLTCKHNHLMAFCSRVSLVNFSCSLGQLTHWIWPLIVDHFSHHFTIWLLSTIIDQMAKWSVCSVK
jgi:hypothetical protein